MMIETGVDSSVAKSIVSANAPTSDEITDKFDYPNVNGDGLIGWLMHGLGVGFRTFDRFVADKSCDLPDAFQCSGNAMAVFPRLLVQLSRRWRPVSHRRRALGIPMFDLRRLSALMQSRGGRWLRMVKANSSFCCLRNNG
jgi:hypothetical protein